MADKSYGMYDTTTGFIVNVVNWDEELNPHITWPDGYAVVPIPDGIQSTWFGCGIGWSYIDGKFIEPPKPPEPDKT